MPFPVQGCEALHALPSAVKDALLVHMERVKALGRPNQRRSSAALRPQLTARVRPRPVVVHRKKGGWMARCCTEPGLC
eukprot:Skav211498  [mRNA]  locus=scaffold2188:772944:773177:+ [translate_table: standard]